MKFTAVLNFALMGMAAAVPTPTTTEDDNTAGVIAKRASVTEVCDIGYANGASGGKGGSTTTVSTLAQFTKAAETEGKQVIVVKGTIKGSARVKVKSNKTVIGATNAKLEGVGLYILRQKNVIVRNLAIAKVKAANGDAINIQESTKIWVDHCDLSSDLSHGKDYYDGLLDVNHASDMVTISNTFFHDHYKTSLVGHSDDNSSEDKGKLHVTYANNYWYNVGSRNPSVRFGTVHIYNNYYLELSDSKSTGINTRMGAKVRVESTVFDQCSPKMLFSADSKQTGSASVSDVSWGSSKNTAPSGGLSSSSIPYKYTVYGKGNVRNRVYGTAGNTLKI